MTETTMPSMPAYKATTPRFAVNVPGIGEKGVGTLVSFLLVVINFILVILSISGDFECHKTLKRDGVNGTEAVCNDAISYIVNDHVDGGYNHQLAGIGYICLVATTTAYVIFIYGQLSKWMKWGFGNAMRPIQFQLSWLLVVLHMVALITFRAVAVTGREEKNTHAPSGGHDPDKTLWDMGDAMIYIYVTLVFSVLIAGRYTVLRFLGGSTTASFVKGEFGAGSSRVAERYPVMGGA